MDRLPIVGILLGAGSATRFGGAKLTRMSESKRPGLAAIGDSRVIPGELERDPGSSVFWRTTLGSRLRGNDEYE